jgi:hypothetical protein
MTLKDLAYDMLADGEVTPALEALAKECATWARHEPKQREAWKRVRNMLLKTAAVAQDVGL